MKRTAAIFVSFLVYGSAFAQPPNLVGQWRNTSGREVRFNANGTIDIAGIGRGTYKSCTEEGDDLCVDYDQFRCEFHATYEADSGTLLLVTGRPTKNCPDGRFTRIQPNG